MIISKRLRNALCHNAHKLLLDKRFLERDNVGVLQLTQQPRLLQRVHRVIRFQHPNEDLLHHVLFVLSAFIRNEPGGAKAAAAEAALEAIPLAEDAALHGCCWRGCQEHQGSACCRCPQGEEVLTGAKACP